MKQTTHSGKFNPLSSVFRVTLSFVVLLMALAATPSASAGDTALTPGPVVTLRPNRLQFECRPVINSGCQCANYGTATLSNVGSATLRIHGITTTGDFS